MLFKLKLFGELQKPHNWYENDLFQVQFLRLSFRNSVHTVPICCWFQRRSAWLAERKDAHDQTNTKQQLLLLLVLLIGFRLVFMCETNLAAAAEINHILQQQFVWLCGRGRVVDCRMMLNDFPLHTGPNHRSQKSTDEREWCSLIKQMVWRSNLHPFFLFWLQNKSQSGGVHGWCKKARRW